MVHDQAAQELWRNVFKLTRIHTRRRIDLGQLKSATDSLAELERERHQFVATNSVTDSAASSSGCQPGSSHAECEVGKRGWTSAHEEELQFNKLKRKMAMLEQSAIGSIPMGKSKRLREAVDHFKQYDALTLKEYLAKKTKPAAACTPRLHGACVFIATAGSPDLSAKLIKLEAIIKPMPATATICIVDDTAQLPEDVQWSLMLGGGANGKLWIGCILEFMFAIG